MKVIMYIFCHSDENGILPPKCYAEFKDALYDLALDVGCTLNYEWIDVHTFPEKIQKDKSLKCLIDYKTGDARVTSVKYHTSWAIYPVSFTLCKSNRN